MAVTRRLRLTRFAAQRVNFEFYGAYRIRIEVQEVEGPDLDPFIFIFRRRPISPYTNTSCDDFCAVAGPSQLADIPPVEPDPDQSFPFYRLDHVELDFASITEALEVWEIIKQEACILVEGLGKLAQLEAVEDHWCPSPPDDAGAPSASASISESTGA